MTAVTRLPALDLMRFGAASAVVLYHYVSGYSSADAGPVLSAVSSVTRYGYLGVDLFFMISGFVILWSSIDRDVTGFVISRISRLYPSFWVSLLFTVLCIYLLAGTMTDAATIAANATMLPTILDAPLVEGVYWTLEIEIRFYALIFLLLVFRQMPRVELWLYGWLLVSIAGLFVEMPWIIKYAALQPYGSFFVAGCVFYLVLVKGATVARLIALAVSAVTCAYVSLSQRGGFITADAVSAVVVPGMVLVFFVLFALMTRSTTQWRFAQSLGALTYPLYLTHATMGLLVYGQLQPRFGVGVTLIIISALAMAIAWVITMTVDIPARKPVAKFLFRVAEACGFRKPALT